MLEKDVEWREGANHSEENQDKRDEKHGSEPRLFLSPEPVIGQPSNKPDHNSQCQYASQRPTWPIKLQHICKGWKCRGQDSKQAKNKAANTCCQYSGSRNGPVSARDHRGGEPVGGFLSLIHVGHNSLRLLRVVFP